MLNYYETMKQMLIFKFLCYKCKVIQDQQNNSQELATELDNNEIYLSKRLRLNCSKVNILIYLEKMFCEDKYFCYFRSMTIFQTLNIM